MTITVAALTVSVLAVATLAIIAVFFRRKARLVAARLKMAEERASTLSDEISRQRHLRSLESRVGVVVSVEYTIEELRAFDLVQNGDIVRDAVANQWVPVMSSRQDLSSGPEPSAPSDPFTSVYYTPESRHEEVTFESFDQKTIRIIETEAVRQVWGGDPSYPGAGGAQDLGLRTVVREITFRPSSG